MDVSSAVITAAGRDQRQVPFQVLIDRDGVSKTVLEMLVEEVLDADIDRICIVVHPQDEERFARAAGYHARRLTFVHQTEPLGYGHALLCAAEFVGDRPFLHTVGDHLYLPHGQKRLSTQLVDIARVDDCVVSAVQATHESLLPYHGIVAGTPIATRSGFYEISAVREKPSPTEAEREFLVPGLRIGYYLSFTGIHVLNSSVIGLLRCRYEELKGSDRLANQDLDLASSLNDLSRIESYMAVRLDGDRYDVGLRYGTLEAQLALGLNGQDRPEVQSILQRVLFEQGNRSYRVGQQ